jgi:hypothetical protein
MATQNGSLFSAGIRILLIAPNTPLVVDPGGGPIGYLHFKDSAGNTIVPTYEREGLQTAVGSFDGASITLPSALPASSVPDTYIAPPGYNGFAATVGATHQVKSGDLGFDEGTDVQLPLADLSNKGQTITIVEISSNALDLGASLGGTSPYLRVLPPLGQPLRAVPVHGPDNAYYLQTSLTQTYPFATFMSTGDAWVCVSRSSF